MMEKLMNYLCKKSSKHYSMRNRMPSKKTL